LGRGVIFQNSNKGKQDHFPFIAKVKFTMQLFRRQSLDDGTADPLERIDEQSVEERKDTETNSVDGSDAGNNGSSSNDSGTGTSIYTGSPGSTEDDMKEIKQELARHETEQVLRLRVLVMLILVAAAASVSLTVYYIAHRTEVEEFDAAFQSVSEKIIDTLNGEWNYAILYQHATIYCTHKRLTPHSLSPSTLDV
jgi:hypothetical protein